MGRFAADARALGVNKTPEMITLTPEQFLDQFNRKAAKLESSSFAKHIRRGKLGVSAVLHDSHYEFASLGPEREAIDAFVLTFRFFIQDKDVSIRQLEIAYDNLQVGAEWKKAAADARKKLNEFLDGPSNVGGAKGPVTNRELMNVFVYGGLAHIDPKFQPSFDRWASRPEMFLFIEAEFVNVLASTLGLISWLRELNVDVLDMLTADARDYRRADA